METLGNEILQKSAQKFYCNICHYGTSRKSSFTSHLLSAKHKKSIKGNDLETNGNQIMQKLCFLTYTCQKCAKEFKNRSGLWKHKKKCEENNDTENNDILNKELIMMLIKENSDLKNMMLDVCQKIQPTNNTINSHNVNSNNKTFNLNVFLNEHCKDAMNITDFVDSLKLQLSDLESVGKLGFVNGISNIIVKNLNSLDETKRPIHCTDTKREVLYIKDEDKWEKNNESNNKIRKAIKKIANKNARLLPEFKKEHPDCVKSNSKFSDQYNKIIVESMGGSGDNDLEKEDKIIRNIAKEVAIDKNLY
jgi:hypothetical protein